MYKAPSHEPGFTLLVLFQQNYLIWRAVCPLLPNMRYGSVWMRWGHFSSTTITFEGCIQLTLQCQWQCCKNGDSRYINKFNWQISKTLQQRCQDIQTVLCGHDHNILTTLYQYWSNVVQTMEPKTEIWSNYNIVALLPQRFTNIGAKAGIQPNHNTVVRLPKCNHNVVAMIFPNTEIWPSYNIVAMLPACCNNVLPRLVPNI